MIGHEEHISPELVLVDPELAERARRSLPERPPFPPPRTRPLPAPLLVPPPPPPAPLRRELRRTLLVTAAALLAIGGLAADLPGRVADELGESDSPRLATPPRSPSQPTGTSPPPAASPPATAPLDARAFIWVPVRRAVSYRFSLYRGGKLIYSRVATEPRHTLPLRWTFRGNRYELTKGTYRWVVIPRLRVGGGLRDGERVVDASYTV